MKSSNQHQRNHSLPSSICKECYLSLLWQQTQRKEKKNLRKLIRRSCCSEHFGEHIPTAKQSGAASCGTAAHKAPAAWQNQMYKSEPSGAAEDNYSAMNIKILKLCLRADSLFLVKCYVALISSRRACERMFCNRPAGDFLIKKRNTRWRNE